MKSKDQILLEQAYSKVLEGYYRDHDYEYDPRDNEPTLSDFYKDPSPHKVTIEDQIQIPADDVVYNDKGQFPTLPKTEMIGGFYYLEAEAYVDFRLYPEEPASFDSPASGGEFEVYDVTFENIKVGKIEKDGNTDTPITSQNVGEEKYKEILNKLLEAAEKYAIETTEKEV